MTAKALEVNKALAVLTKAQLHCAGKNPISLEVLTVDGRVINVNVLSARFDKNSGNVILTAKE